MNEGIRKLTIDEIAKAQGQYLFSNCGWAMSYRNKNNDEKLCWNEPEGMNYHFIVKYIGREDWIKPALTTLNKITDEHAIEVFKIEGNHENIPHPIAHVKTFFSVWVQGKLHMPYVVSQYLISKGYAVPLWFGINHWANGKTAIELEIAIEQQ